MSVTSQNLSSKQILEAVKDLPNKELDIFINKVLVFQAKRRTKSLPDAETRLLKNIYLKFSVDNLTRLKELRKKQEIRQLDETEYEELISLTDLLEEFHARRMKNIVKLAKMRGLSLEETLEQLGINLPDYDLIEICSRQIAKVSG